jgi:hypothetical protein
MSDRDQKIREQAYRIWEEEGRPEGKHDEHWRRAEEHYAPRESPDAEETTEENWKAEAGMADDKRELNIPPSILTPD